MKTSHPVSDILASAAPFIGIPMNAPKCSTTFPNSAQVIHLFKLIFGGVEVLLLSDFSFSPPFAHSRSPSSHTSHAPPTPSFFDRPPRHSVTLPTSILQRRISTHGSIGVHGIRLCERWRAFTVGKPVSPPPLQHTETGTVWQPSPALYLNLQCQNHKIKLLVIYTQKGEHHV